MPIGIGPDSDKRPLLAEGVVGKGGEAELKSISARALPGANNAGLYYIDFEVQVDDPQQGRLFVHSAAFGAFNAQTADGSKSINKVLLAGVGLDWRTVQFADEADERGNHALLGPNPCPCKVVVDVGVDRYKKKGSDVENESNFIKSIARLG